MEKYPAFRHGRDKCEAECMVCCYGTYVSVKINGAGDLEAHMSRNNHKKTARGDESSSNIEIFFMQEGSLVGERVVAAECTVMYCLS